MPIQILPAGPTKKSFGQKLSAGIGRGLETGQKLMDQHKEEKRKQLENQQLQSLVGEDISGLDPELKKTVLAERLKGQASSKKTGDELAQNRQLLRAIENSRNLEPGSLSAYESDPKMAEITSRPPKEPKKTQASQSIDPNQLKIIKDVRKDPEFLKATPSKKYQMMTDAGISKENAQAESEIAAEEYKAEIGKQKEVKDLEYKYHKESEDYDKELIKNTKVAKKQLSTVKDIEKVLQKGEVGPRSLASVFSGLGTVGDKISKALLSKDESTLLSSIPQLLEGWKDIFGVRLSDADLALLENKLPDIGKTPSANKAVLNIIKKYADQTLLRSQIAKEIKNKNNGLRPLQYEEKIEERYDEMSAPVKLISPRGNEIEVPAYQVGAAIKGGARVPQ
jgi:hypothetical protein